MAVSTNWNKPTPSQQPARLPWMRLTSEEIEEKEKKRKVARDKARARALENIVS
jgi:hypothetical protein